MKIHWYEVCLGSISTIILLGVLLFFTKDTYGQNNNDLMQVTMSIEVPDNAQFDTVVAYNNLEALTSSNDIVECLAVLNDINSDTISKHLDDYITAYIETFQLCGYDFVEGEDLVYKTVYFNKHGYFIPYECAVAQLQDSNTNVKVLRDDEYQRVYHHEIQD